MKMFTRFASLTLALAMMLSLTACGSSNSAENETSEATATSSAESETSEATVTSSDEPQYGGSATFYSEEIQALYDPGMDNSYSYAFFLEGLWAIDWDSDEYDFSSRYISYKYLDGQIADSWEWDEDNGILTVTLRDDVYFQDKEPYNGRKVTATDVEWSYCRLLGLNGYEKVSVADVDWDSSLATLAGVTVVDDLTIQFQLVDNTEVTLDGFMITEVNIGGPEWDELTEEQQSSVDYACGTGPYILTELSVDNYALFEKNENYYDYDDRYPENKLPYLDSVKLVYIADSANILTQFIAGELDYIGWRSNLLSSSERQQLEDSLDSSEYIKVGYDTGPMSIGLKMNTEPFDDIRVRTAMQMAIDIETNTIYTTGEDDPEITIPGLWSTLLVDYTSVGTWSDELTSEFAYDPEGAKELLAEAGYADGFEFTVVLNPVADTNLYLLAQSQLADVGIIMNIETVSSTAELLPIQTNETDGRAYFSGTVGTDSLGSSLNLLFIPGGVSYGFFYETLDEGQTFISLIEDIQNATTLEEYAEAAQAADMQFADSHFCITLAGNSYVYDYMSSHLGGWTGEKLKANYNMRTIVARLWSTTGE